MSTPARPILAILVLTPAVAAAQTAAAQFSSTVVPYLSRNCTMCHNGKVKTANLNLERLKDPVVGMVERDVWELVAQRLRAGVMPPKAMPKPEAAATSAVVEWAESRVDAIDRERKPDPGRVTARRLNRAEYNNTVRDLLGVAFRPADDFPLDDSGHGFDNIADVLSLSPLLMERYLKAADQIVRTAIVAGPAPKAFMEKFDADKVGEPKEIPTDPEGERLIRKGSLVVKHRFPVDGEYELRVFARGRGAPGSPDTPLALILGGKVAAVEQLQQGANAKRTFDARMRVTAGVADLGAAWRYPGPLKPPPIGADGVDYTMYVESIEVRGPFLDAGAGLPESHKRIFICTPPPGQFDAACAEKILRQFAGRAWRRPVTAAEAAKLLSFVEMARKEGDTFEQGIQLAVKAALVSPHFLFRTERDPAQPGAVRELDGYELASRLSYFIWSSMPDDELLRLAGDGSLSRPAVLAAQVKRMLADPKATALAENFAGQWLELRNLNSVSPDPKRFPTWDADLREAMRRETQMFFAAVLREDRSILDFINGKFTYINERLAQHYGISGVTGRKFQRVEVDGAQRSGVLTHASVLTISSYPTRTSPVQRGLWVMENFLATPPPVPPANVPALKEEEIGTAMSLRQQLERHRADPSCAVCHDRMDPLGLGLENYDAVGAWRTLDGKFPVDAAGVLPGGQAFTTPAQMKEILLADSESFTRCLTEKLLTYALGRGLESADKSLVRAITRQVQSDGHRFGRLVQEVVQSPAFRMRRGAAARTVAGIR